MNPIAIILLVLLILLLCNKSSMFSTGGEAKPCPPGYIVARCIGPGGSRVCIPHPVDPSKPTVYV